MLIDKNLIGERTRQEHEEEIKRLDKFINIIYEDIKKYEVLNDWKELIL